MKEMGAVWRFASPRFRGRVLANSFIWAGNSGAMGWDRRCVSRAIGVSRARHTAPDRSRVQPWTVPIGRAVGPAGLEPATRGLKVRRSVNGFGSAANYSAVVNTCCRRASPSSAPAIPITSGSAIAALLAVASLLDSLDVSPSRTRSETRMSMDSVARSSKCRRRSGSFQTL